MDATENKKVALLMLMKILREYTDENHPMTQAEIKDMLYNKYEIEVERKKIGRDLELLKEIGWDIASCSRGCYLTSREFEDSELHLLIDAVLGCRNISQKQSNDLINKICSLSSTYFKSRAKNIHTASGFSQTDNVQLFYNIEAIDYAITTKTQISYSYYKYQKDLKLHKSSEWIMHPYGFVLNNQRYYLVAYNDSFGKIMYHRIDRIHDIKVLDEKSIPVKNISGYEHHGIDYKNLTKSTPYMYSDTPETIEFLVDECVIDQVVDWFGKGILVTPWDDKRVRVKLTASPTAMSFWAMQYSEHVEITYPESLRNTVVSMLEKAVEKYKG